MTLSGCGWLEPDRPQAVEAMVEIEPVYRGTVAEHARLADLGYLPVSGYGVVVALGQNGSQEVPPRLESLLVKQLSRHGLGWWRHGTERVTPMRILRDPDTAIVRIKGKVPAGAPKETHFDVEIQAVGNQAKSLEGGILMTCELYRTQPGVDVAMRSTHLIATAKGPVYINPFIDPTDPKNVAKLRAGRVIGGGRVVEARSVNLQMVRANAFDWASYIQRRINQRFSSRLSPRVANAKDASIIKVSVPREFQHDYRRFIRLLPNVPLQPDATRHARQIAEAFAQPGADLDRLSLIWEAIGQKALPVAQDFYTSERDELAFYAARAGIRIGDTQQAPRVLGRLAKQDGPMQVPAIYELGQHRRIYSQLRVLYEGLDSPDAQVQLAAYNALIQRGDLSRITRTDLPDGVVLDVVETSRPYAIYVASTGEPRIVLFGKDMKIADQVFFEAPRRLLTVDSRRGEDKIRLWRKTPRSGRMSSVQRTGRLVSEFVTFLASLPETDYDARRRARETGDDAIKVKGFSMTYGQVVSVLYRMCDQGHIPATFVLR